jgi:hypothetical protein
VGRQVEERAAAEIVDDGKAALPAQRDQLGELDLSDEAALLEVAAVHLQEQRRVGADGALVVVPVGAVGGPHLDQADAGAGDDLRQAEGPADLDQLAPRDDHLAAPRQGVEGQQQGRRVVVDGQGRLGAAEYGELLGHGPEAVTPPARVDVELQVAVAGRRRRRGRGGRGQGRPPQVRVEHDARRIDDRGRARRGEPAGQRPCARDQVGLAGRLGCSGSRPQGVPRLRQGTDESICRRQRSPGIALDLAPRIHDPLPRV